MIQNQTGVTLVANEIQNTTRLFKITKFLTESGRVGSLTIIGFWREGLKLKEEYLPNVIIERKKTFKQQFPRVEFGFLNKLLVGLSIFPLFLNVLISCMKNKPGVIYCHDVVMLPCALITKLFTSCEIIYMPHELETLESGSGKVVNFFLAIIERIGMKYVKHTTVVSPGIAEWYKKSYKNKEVSIIRNIPEFSPVHNIFQKKLRKELNLAESDIIFIYQGLIEKTRGIVEVSDTFSKISQENKHLVFMGYGPEVKLIEEFQSTYQNIHYLPAVDPDDIFSYTSDADCGVLFISQNISKSYEYSLPNKYFEYVKSGIPILLSNNLMSIASEVSEHNTGWVINSVNEDLLVFLQKIKKNQIEELKANVALASDKYNWESEVKLLLEF